MTSTIARLRKAATEKTRRIILPEANDVRVIEAANKLAEAKLAAPILVGSQEELEPSLAPGITVVSPESSESFDSCVRHLFDRRKHKGLSIEQAEKFAKDPVYFAALLVATGQAEGMVAGSISPTPHVVRAALHCVGIAQDTSTLSSFFLMQFPVRAVTFADCGLVPDPNEEQLADIAIAAAGSHQRLTGEAAKVAMLSFSTHGSANHPRIDKVIRATELVKSRAPNLEVDGELQFDAAWVPEVAQRKCPESTVAGKANVFVFPDLDSGNIAYKITERLGGAQALGPLIQGAAKPIMDLSRGCSSDDIVDVAVIASTLAGEV